MREYLPVIATFGMFILGGIFTVLWYLLRQKDAHQEELIRKLFTLHDEDAKELQSHRLMIAEKHYQKPELDAKFDKIEASIKDGFSGVKLDLEKTNDGISRLNAILLGRTKFTTQDSKHEPHN